MSKHWVLYIYHPQQSCEGYVFTGICLSTGMFICLPQCMLGYPPGSRHHPGSRHPLRSRHPLEQTPLWEQTHPLGVDTPQEQTPPGSRHPPRSRHPQEQTPPPPPEQADSPPPHPSRDAPGADTPPPPGHCCGLYASYWNAFLSLIISKSKNLFLFMMCNSITRNITGQNKLLC